MLKSSKYMCNPRKETLLKKKKENKSDQKIEVYINQQIRKIYITNKEKKEKSTTVIHKISNKGKIKSQWPNKFYLT